MISAGTKQNFAEYMSSPDWHPSHVVRKEVCTERKSSQKGSLYTCAIPGILALQAMQHPRETASLISWDEPLTNTGIASQGLTVSQLADTPLAEAPQQFGERDSSMR